MKKVWKCPNCAQISSRYWNLKRHIDRRHKTGAPNLAYLSGNSTFDFASTTPPHSYSVQNQNHAFRKTWREDRDDNWFDRTIGLLEMQQMVDQSMNANPVKHFPKPPTQLYDAYIHHPIYTTVNESQNKPTRNFDGVIGFKIDVCKKCLTTNTMEIGPESEDWRIQDIHKCQPSVLYATEKLDPLQLLFNFDSKVKRIPELLFQKCKDWASNTTGTLYLIARRLETLVEYEKVQIPENYKEIPWLNKVLLESKITPNDTELYEFLRLIENRTTKFFTFGGTGAMENFVYKIGISTVPIPSW